MAKIAQLLEILIIKFYIMEYSIDLKLLNTWWKLLNIRNLLFDMEILILSMVPLQFMAITATTQ